MSNKTQLQTNNTALDTLIARVNAAKDTAASLPSAGGGSGGGNNTETVPISVTADEPGVTIFYMDGSITFQQSGVNGSHTFNVLKGSIFVMTYYTNSTINGATTLSGNSACRAFLATGLPHVGGGE